MSVVVVGSSEPVGALTAALGEVGVDAEAHVLGSPGGLSAEALSAALVEIEQAIAEREPEAIVAIGPGDAATAAALVAGKAGIALITLLDSPGGVHDEALAVAELSAARVAFPHDGPGVGRAADEIAGLLATG